MNKVLVVDTETSGIPDDYRMKNFTEGPQILELAASVCRLDDNWKVEAEFDAKIQWLGPADDDLGEYPMLTWNNKAEEIHGITRTMLKNSPHPIDIAKNFESFLYQHFQTQPILIGGHNPGFDRYFVQQLFVLAGIQNSLRVKFHHRMLDSFTAGYMICRAETSDELFGRFSHGKLRQVHSAREDVELTVNAFRGLDQETV